VGNVTYDQRPIDPLASGSLPPCGGGLGWGDVTYDQRSIDPLASGSFTGKVEDSCRGCRVLPRKVKIIDIRLTISLVVVEGIPDRFEHGIQLLENLKVPEPHDPKSARLEPGRSHFISINLGCMLAAIEFDDQSRPEADEIDDIVSNRILLPELLPIRLPLLEMVPEAMLGLRHVLSEVAGEVAAH
jgi:hypothetical protein